MDLDISNIFNIFASLPTDGNKLKWTFEFDFFINLESLFVKIGNLMEWLASHSIFLFMHYAVGLAIMLFICARNDYLIEDDKLYN